MLAFLVFVFLGSSSCISARLLDPSCMKKAPAGVDPELCCPSPDFIEPSIFDECVDQVFGKDNNYEASSETDESMLFSPTIRCLSECIFNKTGIYKNGEIQGDKVTDGIDGIWLPLVTEAYKVCKAIVAKTQFEKLKNNECSYIPTFYMACLDTQVFKNCPESVWKTSDGCNNLKATAEQCPIAGSVLRSG